MPDFVDETTGAAGRRELNREELDGLLDALGPDRHAGARQYERLRRRFIDLFSWRGCETPEELADETLNRLARRLAQGEPVKNIESYGLGIARMQLKEVARGREKRAGALRELRFLQSGRAEETEMLDSIERCLKAMPESSQTFIARYYGGNREQQARELGLSLNALRARALRIRQNLYECVTSRDRRVTKPRFSTQ
jgi:DNA-directed RNA polymerase specialized sigma24 family protein